MGVIKRQSLKGSIINYAGVALGALFFLIILPNIIDKTYLGFYQLVTGLVLLFGNTLFFGTGNVLYRFYHKWNDDKIVQNYNALALSVILISGGLMTIVYALAKEPILKFYSRDNVLFEKYFFILPPLFIIQSLSTYFDFFAMMKLRISVPAFIREFVLRVLLIIVFLLLAFQCVSEKTFVLLYVFVYVIAFIILLVYLIHKLGFKLGSAKIFIQQARHKKEMLQYAGSSLGLAFVTNLQLFADVIILPMYLGLGMLGIYGRPITLGQMINIPYRSIAYISAPIIQEAWIKNDVKKIATLNKDLSLHLLLIGLFLFGLIVLNADHFFMLLKPEYALGKNVLYIVAFARLFDMSFGLNTEIIYSSKYYRFNVYFSFITLLITLVCMFIFIPKWQMQGAAWAAAVPIILFNIAKNIFIYKKFKFHCFSKSYFPLIIIALIAITIIYFIPYFYFPSFHYIVAVLINVVIKSMLFVFLFLLPVYYLKITTHFNDFIQKLLSGKLFKGAHKMENL